MFNTFNQKNEERFLLNINAALFQDIMTQLYKTNSLL